MVRRLRLGELLDEAFQLLKATFSRLIVFQALIYAPSLALAAFAVHAAGRWLTGLLEGELEPQLPSLIIGTLGFFFGFLALQVLLGAITQVALTKGAAQTYLGQGGATVASLFSHAQRLFLRSLGLGLFLTLLLGFAFSVPTAALAAAAALVVGSGAENLIIAVLLVLAGGVFGLGGLVFATLVYLRYALASAVLAFEDTSVAQALARSVALMKGRYGSALALLSILTAIGLMVGGVLSLVVPTPAFEGKDLGEIRALLPQLIRSQMMSQVLGQVAGALSGLYTSVCWTLFYFSARCDAEGFDLAHQAAKLGEE